MSAASSEIPSPSERTWAEVDLEALRGNARALLAAAGGRAKLLAVVKAGAYGHGAVPVSRALRDVASLFGVACNEEADELDAGSLPILLLSPSLPEAREEVVVRGWIPSVSSAEEAAAFGKFGPCRVNFKVDTGMGRIGCWQDDAETELAKLAGLPGIEIHSISTHLPSADCDEEFTRIQIDKWNALRSRLGALAPGALFHALNSTACFRFADAAADIVRAGLGLYGCVTPAPTPSVLRPALAWKARVLLVRSLNPGRTVSYGRTFKTERPTRAATLAVGYADGYPIQASGNGAAVLINARRCPVLGRVTMDQIVVDVSEVGNVRPGDTATLIGKSGNEHIPVEELAQRADSIPWEIFTGLGRRVRRFYSG